MSQSYTEDWFNMIKPDVRVNPERANEYPMKNDYVHDFDYHTELVDEIVFSIKNTYYSFFENNKTD